MQQFDPFHKYPQAYSQQPHYESRDVTAAAFNLPAATATPVINLVTPGNTPLAKARRAWHISKLITACAGHTMLYGITDLTTFILGTIFIVLLPGPNSLYVMAAASRWGVAAGYRGAFGVFTGDLILMVLAATGTASLLRTTPELFLLIKYAGAAYLTWVGFGLLRTAISRWRGHSAGRAPAATTEMAPRGIPRTYRTALVISLMNPKAILFFVSFFIQFVDPTYAHPGLSFMILGVIVQIVSVIYLSALIFGGAYLAAQFHRRQRLAAGATGGIGALFIGFGAKLATATLS